MTSQIFKLAATATLLACFAVASPAMAEGHGRGDWHGGGRGGGWGWGLFGLGLGLALTAPYHAPAYYYPPTYYPPAYYPQQQVVIQPPIYASQPAPQAPAAQANNWWFYCSNPAGYYPYVSTCASGWQKVSPTPSD